MKKKLKKKPIKKQYPKETENKKLILWGLFFEKLLQNLEACAVVTDARGKIVFVNRQHLDCFSCTQPDIVGRDWIKTIIPVSKHNAVERIFEKIKKNRMLSCFDSPANAPQDESKYISWTCIPLKEGQTYYYMFIGLEEKRSKKLNVKAHVISSAKRDKTYKKIIDLIFNASMVSDPLTAVHAARVMLFAVMLAKRLGLSKIRIERLKAAALLHDLGKLVVDEKILLKKGKLNKREFEEIKKHPYWGSNAVKLVHFLRDIIPIMICHHENYDGSGYPKGIKGKSIPLEARILSVADIFEALTADRPYRKGFAPEKAIEIMESEKGHKLDPAVTDLFFRIVKTKKVQKEYF